MIPGFRALAPASLESLTVDELCPTGPTSIDQRDLMYTDRTKVGHKWGTWAFLFHRTSVVEGDIHSTVFLGWVKEERYMASITNHALLRVAWGEGPYQSLRSRDGQIHRDMLGGKIHSSIPGPFPTCLRHGLGWVFDWSENAVCISASAIYIAQHPGVVDCTWDGWGEYQ